MSLCKVLPMSVLFRQRKKGKEGVRKRRGQALHIDIFPVCLVRRIHPPAAERTETSSRPFFDAQMGGYAVHSSRKLYFFEGCLDEGPPIVEAELLEGVFSED